MDIKAFLTICIFVSLLAGDSNGHTVCGKIGQDIYLHLRESNGSSLHEVEWKHDDISITRKNAEVFGNGTLKLKKVRRSSSGVYTASVYDAEGRFMFRQSTHLTVTDPPVVELVICTLEIAVLHCAGENGPDAVYEWNVSVPNQGLRTVSNYTGKYVLLNNSIGNISCSLKKGNYFSRSDAYFLSCTDMKWCLSLEFTVLLVLLCFMTCGISVAVQIWRKLQNSSEKSEQDNTSLVRTQDDAVIYSEVRVGIQQK